MSDDMTMADRAECLVDALMDTVRGAAELRALLATAPAREVVETTTWGQVPRQELAAKVESLQEALDIERRRHKSLVKENHALLRQLEAVGDGVVYSREAHNAVQAVLVAYRTSDRHDVISRVNKLADLFGPTDAAE